MSGYQPRNQISCIRIPKQVRVSCATSREEDPEGAAEPYAYTTLIHLREILDTNWPLFLHRLPEQVATDKKQFLRELVTFNTIRNKVMHPTRLDRITDDDFEFAREMHRKLRIETWRPIVQQDSPSVIAVAEPRSPR